MLLNLIVAMQQRKRLPTYDYTIIHFTPQDSVQHYTLKIKFKVQNSFS